MGLAGYIAIHQIFYIPKVSGITTTREITPTEINSLKISWPFNTTIQQGEKNQIEIIGDQNFQECVLSQIIDNNIEIYFNNKCNFIGIIHIPIQINISIQSLEKLEIAGAINLKGNGEIQLENDLELYISGASEAKLNINGKNITGKVSWASEANLTIKANQADFKANWASEIKLQITANNLSLEASGSSEIEAKGESEYVQASISGASELNAKGLIAQQADLKASWASEIEITAIQILSQKATGASEIEISK